jgi:hypothetical protein
MRLSRLLPVVLLAACGQSGDLYLPAEQPQPQAAPTPPAPAPAEQPPDEKKDKK